MLKKIKEHWDEILLYMKKEFDIMPTLYNTWVPCAKPEKFENGTLSISLPSSPGSFVMDFFPGQFSNYLVISIEAITMIHCNIVYFERDEKMNLNDVPEDNSSVSSYYYSLDKDNEKYTFDNFVVGQNNKFAHAAALAVASSPNSGYNPLFLYGGSGLGKTHLMYSIANYISKTNPQKKVIYVPSENFTNEIIEAIKLNKSSVFHEKYRSADVLLIDDIQFIIGKERSQEEFFNTFNYLYEKNKQIVISSDRPPKAFNILDERLRSRFGSGLSVDISTPDYETRMAILRKKEEIEGITLDNEILSYIATNIVSNIRELEGALTKVNFYARLYNSELTLSMAEDALKDLITPDSKKEVTLEKVITIVSEHYKLSSEDMVSSKRNKEIAFPRQVAMYLCKKLTSSSLQQIATALNKKDHTTVLHGISTIENEIAEDKEFAETIDVLIKKIQPNK